MHQFFHDIFFILPVLTVQFDPVTYTVTEGGQASLRVVLNFAADGAVTVDIATNDDSAIGENVWLLRVTVCLDCSVGRGGCGFHLRFRQGL